MREILSRGKRLDNGEWVEGYYVGPCDGCDTHEISDIHSPLGTRIEVDSFTVGQYTGLTDKNGKRIFEGDIIQRLCDVYAVGRRERIRQRMVTGVVIWDSESEHSPGYWCIDTVDEYGNKTKYLFDNSYEVIGNIHDNPELVEEERI